MTADAHPMSDDTVRSVGAASGIAGAIALAAYFGAPAILTWPPAGASGPDLAAYARSHEVLFYLGAWLQVTGALLSVTMFLAIVRLARAGTDLAGLVTMTAASVLLGVIVIEAAFLVAVPISAAAGDVGTVSTTFALSNGVFVRVFPLAPASASLIGLGFVLRGSRVLGRSFGNVALGLGVAFEAAGLLAVFSSAGLALAIVLSVVQSLWVLAAAVALGRSRGRSSA